MVGIRKIEAVVTAMNGGDPTGIKGRLQYLNLQSFPPGLRVGASRRADYGLDEILAFTVWFSLVQASATPASAMAMVADFWPELARLYLNAAAEADVGRPARGLATIGAIAGNALRSPTRDAPSMRSPARAFDIASLEPDAGVGSLARGLDAVILLDFDRLHAAMAAAMIAAPEPVDAGTLAEMIGELARREGPADDATGTPPATGAVRPDGLKAKTPAGRGERFGEADYYFSRAIELLDGPGHDDSRTDPPRTRVDRTIRYVLRPAVREGWKRWVEVGSSGVPFYDAIAAFANHALGAETPVPETIQMSAVSRITDGSGDIELLRWRLRETAIRGLEADPAGT